VTDPRSNPPTGVRQQPLSRAALERVLARAAQLQAASGDADDAGAMTEEQLVALGKEVGISGELLRQALAEERSRTLVPAESGWLAALAGVSAVTAARTVPGGRAAVLGALDAWMQRNEGLEVQRRFADQLVWEARRDVFSAVRRALTAGSGLELAAASGVSAIVAEVSPGQSHVRVVADFTSARNQRAVRAVAVALLFSVMIAAPLLSIGIPPLFAAIFGTVVPVAALFVARSRYHHLVARAQVALEQALDRLEFGDAKPVTTAQVLRDALLGPPRPPG
jgi:hypothetical protein